MRNKHEIETCTCTFGFYYINFTRYWPSIIMFFPSEASKYSCQEMLKWQKGMLTYYYKVSSFRLALWFDFYRLGQTQSPFGILAPTLTRQYLMEACDVTFLTLLMEEFLVRMMSCNSPNLFNSCKFPTNLHHIWRKILFTVKQNQYWKHDNKNI